MSRKAIQGLMILALATVGSITSPAFAQSDATAPGTVITQSTDGLSLAEFGELQANFARTAGTAIVAAQSCPGVQLDGAELEIVGAPLGVTIEELLNSMKDQFREGYEVFVGLVNEQGLEAACDSALANMGPETDLAILELVE